jgi:hypothetical protein
MKYWKLNISDFSWKTRFHIPPTPTIAPRCAMGVDNENEREIFVCLGGAYNIL